MYCAPGARGGCSPTICLHGGPRSTTSAPGGVKGPGSVFMGLCVTGSVSPKAGMCSAKHWATNPLPPSDLHPLPSFLRTRVLLWTHELCRTHRPGLCEPPRAARLPARKLPRSYGETVTFLLKMARSVYKPYSIRLKFRNFFHTLPAMKSYEMLQNVTLSELYCLRRCPKKVPSLVCWGWLELALRRSRRSLPRVPRGDGGVSPRCHSGVIHRNASYLGHLLR